MNFSRVGCSFTIQWEKSDQAEKQGCIFVKNPVHLAKVDATVETDLAARFEVTGFPTLYIFRKGEKELYDGPRSALGKILSEFLSN